VEKHETTKKRLYLWRLEGGNAAGAIPGCFSNLFNITNTATMMKREYTTYGLWVFGSSLIHLSLVLCLLDAIWDV
jgi:hypothetical protein